MSTEPRPIPPVVTKDEVDRLILAIARECALQFACEGQSADMLTRSVDIWESALTEPQAQAELTTVLVGALSREKARRLA